MKQIICIKWGEEYNYTDCNNLYMMIKNNYSLDRAAQNGYFKDSP